MDRSRDVGRDVGIVLGSFVVLGIGAGVLWWVLAPTASFTKVRTGGAMSEIELGIQFAAVGWYVVIGAVAGLLAGVVLTWWRDRDALLTSLLV
ncbi:MAG: hypothetical protein HOQ45_02240, partial [Nocardioidaceae bacterium]|nr:hypothetical protein [Nocardioidaceae bacterium]